MTPQLPAPFAQRLRQPARLYGTAVISPSPHWVPVVARLGLDFVFIDTEHIPLDRETLAWMCQAYRAAGIPPIVRITSPDPYLACVALDGGATGVIAPYVESPEEVRELVGAVKKRPLKGRTLSRHLAGAGLDPVLRDYVEKGAAARALIVNIESTPALEALDEILAVEGLDGVFVGPHDLSTSLGVPEQYEHPKFLAACDAIITRARARSLGAGVHVIYPANRLAHEERWARLGANFIVHAADIILFSEGIRRDLGDLKARLCDTAASHGASINL
ncbi:MAG: aldolase [Verrucomicrobia bacterium]|nr:aldolase [Verrucomicrobiota bacterium]